MSEIKLLPCPFCGYHGTLNTTNIGKTFYAVCMQCGSRTIDFKTTEEAIEQWNARKPMERILTRLEDIKKVNPSGRIGHPKVVTSETIRVTDKAIKIVKEEGGIE